MHVEDKTAVAARAVEAYAAQHTGTVALPELLDEIARTSRTSATVAKQAVFRAIDMGKAGFKPDFQVFFASQK